VGWDDDDDDDDHDDDDDDDDDGDDDADADGVVTAAGGYQALEDAFEGWLDEKIVEKFNSYAEVGLATHLVLMRG
jgi:hypothetical protein